MALPWENHDAPRDEYFMANEKLSYTYGKGRGERTYTSAPYSAEVASLQDCITWYGSRFNMWFGSHYNVCFLNRYDDQKKWLGWHSDDSPMMDSSHPIAVVSFGVERFINWRPIGHKGVIPKEWTQKLGHRSLFVMPSGFQETHEHKIPKHSAECGVRISLTFRRYKEANEY